MATNKWTTGLFDCCDDCSGCCLTCFCPCIAHGMLSNAVNGGGECAPCCLYYVTAPCCVPICITGPQVRQNLRAKYGLMEAPCGDCCVHFCCHELATCQEIRELKSRGALKGGDANSAAVPLQQKPQPTQNSAPMSPVNATPASPSHSPEYERVVQSNGLRPNGPPGPQPQQTYGYAPPQPPPPPPAQYGYAPPPPPQPPTMAYGYGAPSSPPAPSSPTNPYLKPPAPNPYVNAPVAQTEAYPPASRPGGSQYPPL